MVDQSRRWVASNESTAQGFGCEVALQKIARGPTDDAAGEEVLHDGEVEPTLCRPDVGDVCPQFLVRAIRVKFCALRLGATGQA